MDLPARHNGSVIPSATIRHDPTKRRERRRDGRWLTRQALRRRHLRIRVLTLLEVLGLLAFLALTTMAIERLAFPDTGTDTPFTILIASLLVVALLRFGLRLLNDTAAADMASRTTGRLRNRARAAALSPVTRLRRGESTAILTTRLMEEADALLPWYREHLPARDQALIQPLLILALVFGLDWLAGTLLLATAPLIPLFSALIGFGTASLAEEQRQRLSRLGDHFMDRVHALTTLRLLRRTGTEAENVGRVADAYRQTSMRVLRMAFLSSAVLEFFSAIAIASLAIYIGLALLGYIQFGPAPALNFQAGLLILLLAPEFFQPLRRLAAGYHERAAALAAVPGIRDLVETGIEVPGPVPTSNTDAQWPAPPAVSLKQIGAAWPGSHRARLHGLNLEVEPGEWIAITGPSGSGKSMLADTLLGWLAPAGGRIFLDGEALDAITPSRHRHQIAWLGQQPHLLPGSLRTNLDPGRRHSRAALRNALAQVGLATLPDRLTGGLDTQLGERGAGLSGGEAQRLALARTLLAGVRFLILDEPTASLDTANEHRILACLRKMAGGCTIIMLTHSSAAAGAADRQYRLSGGRLHHAN